MIISKYSPRRSRGQYSPKIAKPEANGCFRIFTQAILISFISLIGTNLFSYIYLLLAMLSASERCTCRYLFYYGQLCSYIMLQEWVSTVIHCALVFFSTNTCIQLRRRHFVVHRKWRSELLKCAMHHGWDSFFDICLLLRLRKQRRCFKKGSLLCVVCCRPSVSENGSLINVCI